MTTSCLFYLQGTSVCEAESNDQPTRFLKYHFNRSKMSWVRQTNDGSFETAELILGGIMPIVLIVIGTIGNLLCILCLLQRKHRRARSTYIYLILLFLVDTFSLYQWNLNYVAVEFDDSTDLSSKSLFLCRSMVFLSFYTLHLSALFLTLISLDRTLLLWSRYYRLNMTQRRQALIVSIVVFILLFALDAFLLSFGVIDKDNHQIRCYQSFNIELMYFYTEIYPWIHLVIMYIIPFMIMISGMILIIIKLYHRRMNTRHFNQKQRLSLMLVGMCTVYMVLTLPNRLCFSVFFSRIVNHNYTDTILLGSNTLLYTRNATNIFFLYMSSTTFRKQLTKFYCCCRYPSRNRVAPIQQVPDVMRSHHSQLWN